jgi:aminobenzoyl-glutamate utilization protein B
MIIRKKIKIAALIILFILTAAFVCGATGKRKITSLKKQTLKRIDEMRETLNQAAKEIWDFAELAMGEYKSSELLAKMLEDRGFEVERGVAGVPVAFVATFGQGHPIIGILGEYDALPGLSQKAGIPEKQVIEQGAPGHGCGHNLFGVAGAGAVMAIKEVMEKYKLKGTVKFFGCPAEETVEGKIYMARDGVFADLDICFEWHPSSKNQVSLGTSNALNNFEVTFHGRTAHAAGDPWNGRSALDALELMNHGLNYLREHVKPTVRLHYVLPDAGMAPNVVPDYARGWYYVRGKDRPEVEDVYARVLKIAEGAALMSGTTHEVRVNTGVYNYLKNRAVAELLYKNLQWVGAPEFSEEEQKYAKRMQRFLGKKEDGLSTTIEPFKEPEGYWGGGSTDAADVSWLVPTASMNTACSPLNIPGHSWCVVSASGSSVGYKGMITAAKVFSASVVEVLLNPTIVKRAQAEFKEKTKGFVYKCAIPKGQKPRMKNRE